MIRVSAGATAIQSWPDSLNGRRLATAKLNNVEPFAYFKGVLECLSNGHPMSRLDELLPWKLGSRKGAT